MTDKKKPMQLVVELPQPVKQDDVLSQEEIANVINENKKNGSWHPTGTLEEQMEQMRQRRQLYRLSKELNKNGIK